MKKIQILHVFTSVAIVALNPANAGTVTPWTPGGANEALFNQLSKGLKAGDKLYSVKIATQNLQVGQTLDLEIVPSNRGNYSFLAEVNFVALNDARQAQIKKATEDKALSLEALATKAKISTIQELRNHADLTDAEKALIMSSAGTSAVATFQESQARRSANYAQRAGRSITSQSAFQSALTGLDAE